MRGLTQWILDWGVPTLTSLGLLYGLSAHWTSPSYTYQVFTLIHEPQHVVQWLSSIAGWLLVPAIIGGVAGHVISARIESVKNLRQQELFGRRTINDRLRPPGLIDHLGSYFHGTEPEQLFADAWVRMAHRNDWLRAQDHWEIVIRDTMCTKPYSHLDRRECLRQTQGTMRLVLLFDALGGTCLVCDQRRR
ncbi:DUF6313 family protein [Streptomyces hyaluromycini]|uniref:DUF6313 family protein n=1 Tax=Streptomyces hyaluromycini TaxID=1377993 RepID=A0ABV1WQX6_9ACTN